MTIDEHVIPHKRRRRQLELAHEDVAEKLGIASLRLCDLRLEAPKKPELLVKPLVFWDVSLGISFEGASGK